MLNTGIARNLPNPTCHSMLPLHGNSRFDTVVFTVSSNFYNGSLPTLHVVLVVQGLRAGIYRLLIGIV